MELLRLILKKNILFNWNNDADKAFNQLKNSFNRDEVLIYPDPNKEFYSGNRCQ